mgnify:FL=1
MNGGIHPAGFGKHMAFGTQELVIVLVAFFILFGAERLPKLARAMGQAKGEFHEGLSDVKKAGDTTEEDLDRGGRTEAAALTEQAEESGVEIDGKTPEEVEDEMAD